MATITGTALPSAEIYPPTVGAMSFRKPWRSQITMTTTNRTAEIFSCTLMGWRSERSLVAS